MIKVSVIIPVYNAENYIRQCMDSVLFQTLKEIEIICVDDGSVDGSLAILMDYEKKYKNVIVLHQDNQGAGAARNKGMEHARGGYVCFMDADDYYAQERALECLYVNAEKNDASVCGGNLKVCYENGKREECKCSFYKEGKFPSTKYATVYYYTRFIFRLKLLRDNAIKFPQYRQYEDPPFLMKIMICAKWFYAVEEVVYSYRVGHKKTKYSFDMAVDMLKGIRECFRLGKENDLIKVYEEHLKNELTKRFQIIYSYANRREIWQLIDEINEVSEEWTGETANIFKDKKSIEEYVAKLKEKKNHMIEKCQDAETVVIYGAGEAGRFFLNHYGHECRHIAGFAVSEKYKIDFVDGYRVRVIDDYDRENLVIVAAGVRYAKEILKNLETLQFKNVCYVEYHFLRLLEEI